MDGRHFIDPAVQFAEVVIGIVNAAPVVIFSVAQQPWPVAAIVSGQLGFPTGGRLVGSYLAVDGDGVCLIR